MTSRRIHFSSPGRCLAAAPAPLARSGLPWLAGFCTLIMGLSLIHI